MAHNSATLVKSSGAKRDTFPVLPKRERPKRNGQLPLHFPLEAKALRTPFRARVLQAIYDIAHRELGDKIESADVFVNTDYYEEPERVALSLTIWANVDQDEWLKADQSISKAVFALEPSWTKEERSDFIDKIDFAVLQIPSSL